MISRIMGIDPSIRNCGMAVVEFETGKKPFVAFTRMICPKAKDWIDAALDLWTQVLQLVREEKPNVIALEIPEFWITSARSLAAVQSQSLLKLAAGAFGILTLQLIHHIPTHTYLPSKWKGQRSKTGSVALASQKMGMKVGHDLAEAILLAIYHYENQTL